MSDSVRDPGLARFYESLIREFPTVRRLHAEFIDDFGEELPDVFVESYVTRWLLDDLTHPPVSDDAQGVRDRWTKPSLKLILPDGMFTPDGGQHRHSPR